MGEVRQEPSYLAIQYLHDTEQYPVSKLCAALHIPRCSYYKWRKREKNKNESLNEQVIEWIKALYIEQNGILGYRQMTIAINRNYHTHFNRKRIHRLMRALQLRSVCRKKRGSYTPSTPEVTAENILNRDFHADKPNEKWLTDVTEFKWYEGPEIRKLYLSAILDLYDRRIVVHNQNVPCKTEQGEYDPKHVQGWQVYRQRPHGGLLGNPEIGNVLSEEVH